MKRLLTFLGLIAFLAAAWVLVPLLNTRDPVYEQRLVGALKFVEQNIEDLAPERGNADAFNSPSMQPGEKPNAWILAGQVEIQNALGNVSRERYSAEVESVCPSYSKRECWRLDKLTLGGTVLIDLAMSAEETTDLAQLPPVQEGAREGGDSVNIDLPDGEGAGEDERPAIGQITTARQSGSQADGGRAAQTSQPAPSAPDDETATAIPQAPAAPTIPRNPAVDQAGRSPAATSSEEARTAGRADSAGDDNQRPVVDSPAATGSGDGGRVALADTQAGPDEARPPKPGTTTAEEQATAGREDRDAAPTREPQRRAEEELPLASTDRPSAQEPGDGRSDATSDQPAAVEPAAGPSPDDERASAARSEQASREPIPKPRLAARDEPPQSAQVESEAEPRSVDEGSRDATPSDASTQQPAADRRQPPPSALAGRDAENTPEPGGPSPGPAARPAEGLEAAAGGSALPDRAAERPDETALAAADPDVDVSDDEVAPSGEMADTGAGGAPRVEEILVFLIQTGLQGLGIDPGTVDGMVGPKTRAAIETYQRRHGLSVNGQPSQDLLNHIEGQLLSPSPRDRAPEREVAQGQLLSPSPPPPDRAPEREVAQGGASDDSGGQTATDATPTNQAASQDDRRQRAAVGEGDRPAAAAEGAGAGAATGSRVEQETLEAREVRPLAQPPQTTQTTRGAETAGQSEAPEAAAAASAGTAASGSSGGTSATRSAGSGDAQAPPDAEGTIRQTASIGRAGTSLLGAALRGSAYAQAAVDAQNSGAIDRAIELYTLAIEADDLSSENLAAAYNNRGVAYRSQGQYEQAIKDYDTAIRLNSNYASAYYNRGIANYNMGRYDRAFEDYGTAISLDPSYANAYHNRAIIYGNEGRFDQAIADLSQAIELRPSLDYAYFNRGRMYEAQGNRERAIEDYRKAYTLNPDRSEYRAKMRELGFAEQS